VGDALTDVVSRHAGAGTLRAAAIVAAAVAAAQLPLFDRTLVSLDEGQLTAIGQRLASGEVLYRDVYTGIFPGIYWFTEALFRLFGADVLVLRWTQLVVNSLTAALLFALARPLAPAHAWVAPAGYWALVVLSFPALTMLSYSSLSLVSALGALLVFCRYIESGRARDGIATGVLLAMATLFKQNFGALALIAALVSGLWALREGALARVPTWRAFLVPIAAGAAVAAAAAARLFFSGAWPSFFEATFITIFESQSTAFNQSLPPVFGRHPAEGIFLFLYGPGALFGAMMRGDTIANPSVISWAVRLGYGSAYLALLLVPFLAYRFAWREDRTQVRIAAKAVLPFASLFFLGIFPSAIWSHLAAVYPPLLVVLSAALGLAFAALHRVHAGFAVLARRVALAGLAVLVLLAARIELGVRSAYAERMMLPAATVRVSRREANLYRAAQDFLTVCAQPHEPVFVAPDMPLLYVATGHANPTPYDLIIPGDVRESVILERLKTSGVDCVVFNPAMYVQFAPFEQLFPGLAAYFTEAFETVRVHEVDGARWHFLRRVRDGRPEEAS
jgi:hypothetical protein